MGGWSLDQILKAPWRANMVSLLGALGCLVRLTNPGTECAKENIIEKDSTCYAPFSVCMLVVASFESQTTLGNGYLGSRIDEERSKMRYLV